MNDCTTCQHFKPCTCPERRKDAGHCANIDGRVLVAANRNCEDWKAKEKQ